MKFNPDCTRDILLALEGLIENGREQFIFESFDDVKETLHLNSHSTEEIEYHLRQCDMSGLLVGSKFPCSGGFLITDISPTAHQFLANTRTKTTWEKVKVIGKKSWGFGNEFTYGGCAKPCCESYRSSAWLMKNISRHIFQHSPLVFLNFLTIRFSCPVLKKEHRQCEIPDFICKAFQGTVKQSNY